jgi:hypothetical protein
VTAKKNPNLTVSQALSLSWKSRPDYTNGLAGTKFHNVWRAFRFTKKGMAIGHEESWEKFENFTRDMLPTYQDGLRLSRIDKKLPFSKENCRWVSPKELTKSDLRVLEYDGQTKTLREWSELYDIPLKGLRQRYSRGRGYTPHDIIFGITKSNRRDMIDFRSYSSSQKKKDKASKMLSAYRCRDKKRGYKWSGDEYPTNEWFTENIILKPCIYCGTDKNVGADRLDNQKPHTIANIVPACYRCNVVRHTHFSHEQMKLIGAFIRDNIDRV